MRNLPFFMMSLLLDKTAVARPPDLDLERGLTLQGEAPPGFLQYGGIRVQYEGSPDRQAMAFIVTDEYILLASVPDAQ